MKNRLTKSRAIYAVNRALPIPNANECKELDDETIASYLVKEVQRMYPHIQFVENLLQRLTISKSSVNIDDEGNTILHACAWHNHAEIIQLIMEHPIGISIIDVMNEDGDTALGIALEQESNEAAEILITSGAHLRIGSTPPLIAALKSNMEHIAMLLIQHDCDIHAMEKLKRTSLMWAIEKRMIHIALKLIKMGASLDEIDFNGDTALIKSCRQQACESIITALIHAGANIQIPDREGRLPGHIARTWVRKRHPELLYAQSELRDNVQKLMKSITKDMEVIWKSTLNKQ